jgi:hypothetical protein
VLTAGGTAFELIPKAGGGWREKVLHSFGEGEDGFQPYGGLIIDASGNLYGTTTFVGVYSNKYGTVFALTLAGAGPGRYCIVSTTRAPMGLIPRPA